MLNSVKSQVILNPNKWVKNYSDLLYGFAFTRLRSKELAEDLIQDTFIAALKAQKSFIGNSSESTWLISILRNKIIDHYRKSSTKNEVSVLENNDFFNEDGRWFENKMPEPWENSNFDEDEFKIQLNKCISKLPSKNMSVFTLKYIDGEETDDLCKELNISSSNYWVLIHRTKLMLRECLQHNWIR